MKNRLPTLSLLATLLFSWTGCRQAHQQTLQANADRPPSQESPHGTPAGERRDGEEAKRLRCVLRKVREETERMDAHIFTLRAKVVKVKAGEIESELQSVESDLEELKKVLKGVDSAPCP